jgi:YD repeat-containing protein
MSKFLFTICLLLHVSVFSQVSLQTGAAEASFPLFQYADAKSRLSTGVSLEYVSGSGMRVNDVASCMGTGWELQAGGFISRMQHGEPDDQKMVNNLGYDIKDLIVEGRSIDLMYPDGYLYTDCSPLNAMPRDACYTPIFVKSSPAEYKPNFDDRELDVFVFQFNGRSGRFVIGKNREVQVLEDSKLRVKFNEGDMLSQKIRTRITDFTITDEDGIQYRFAEKELTEVFKYKKAYDVNTFAVLKGEPLLTGVVNKIVTRWMLTEINNPLTNEKITFNYEDYEVDMDGPKHINQTKVDGKDGKNHMVVERIRRTSKRLLSIITPDSYRVNFNYSPDARIDVPNEKPLKNIAIAYGGNFLYGYDFNYAYFKKNQIVAYNYSFADANEKRYARLCLTDFRKKGNNGFSIPPYVFTYNMPSGTGYSWTVAPQFTLWSDHWGYFNPWNTNVYENEETGNPQSQFGDKICEFSEELYESFGILKSIKYPEGGELEYTFEHNQSVGSPYTNNKIGGIRVKQTKLYDGISHSNDIIKEYKYIDANNATSGWGFELPKYRENMGLRQFKFSSNDNIKGSINAKEIGTSLVSTLLSVRMSQMASGTLGGSLFNPQTLATAGTQMLIALVIAQIIDYFTPDFKDYGMLVIKSDNFNLVNPLPQQYSRVEVKTVGGNNGKVVYDFTNPATSSDYVFRDQGSFAAPFSDGKPRYVNWFYGAPRFITWYNEAGQPVRKVENQYNPVVRELNTIDYLSRSWYVNTNAVNKENNHNLFDYSPSFVTQETYYPIQGRLELIKTIETNYNKNGESVSTEVSYTYSPNNFQVRTVSKKDSKGDYVGTTTYYTADYDITGAINDMKSANMNRVPVSVNSWFKSSQPSSQEQLVNATVTEYGRTGNNDFRPVKTYRSELKAAQSTAVFDAANYKNFTYLKPNAALVYSDGNLVQTTAVYGNSSKSAIYDYKQRQVVAEVTNAIVDEIRHTSFESDAGPWSYDASGITGGFCATGRKCFNLSMGNVVMNAGIDRARPYVVSLWTTGSQVGVSLAGGAALSPSATGPVINGWTYYEYELPAGSLANINISGNGLLDEVRYYPKGAMMTTYTYDPGIGKTTECDPNNRITRYEYDGLGRLVKVKDQFNNLIKTYEYNYKQ